MTPIERLRVADLQWFRANPDRNIRCRRATRPERDLDPASTHQLVAISLSREELTWRGVQAKGDLPDDESLLLRLWAIGADLDPARHGATFVVDPTTLTLATQ